MFMTKLGSRRTANEPISTHAAKTHLSRLIARAEAGEEIIIARGGRKPVVKFVAIETPKPKRVFGRLKGKVSIGPEFFEPLSPEELDAWDGNDRCVYLPSDTHVLDMVGGWKCGAIGSRSASD